MQLQLDMQWHCSADLVACPCHCSAALFCFTQYIIPQGLRAGHLLQEYELALEVTSRAEQLAKQRKNLKKR